MQLVADRFVVHDDGRVVDLATGARVVLTESRVGGDAEQIRWTTRCDLFQRLHHRAIAPLLDYGPIGQCERFEAWQCGRSWAGAPDAAARTRLVAADFLHAAALTTGGSTGAVHERQGVPVVLPDRGAGYVADRSDRLGGDLPLANRGRMRIERSAVGSLAEMFRHFAGPRPHVAALWGPAGSGKTTLLADLARIARINGFVPIASRFVDTPYDRLWQGRSVFVIDDGERKGCCALLHGSMRSPVPHVLLIVGDEEVRGVSGIALGRVSADELAAAVYPAAASSAIASQVRRAAEQARGSPARFARLLWAEPLLDRSGRTPSRALSRAAERSVVYGGDERVEIAVPRSEPGAWPAPGELGALRRQVSDALEDLARGRHAPGIRQLRQAVAALARRDAWTDAADGAVALAGWLLRRGQPGEAHKALEGARTFASRAGLETLLLDAAILAGEAWIDLARLDEAETVLAAAVTMATTVDDRLRIATASLGLARCLFWGGRYDDAAAALHRRHDDVPVAVRVRHDLLAARVAVGRHDFRAAVASAAAVAEAATMTSDSATRAAVACTTAFVHLAIDDVETVRRQATGAVASARQARDPLRAIRARLLLAEADRRRGRAGTAIAQLHRLRRLTGLPPLLKARVDLIASIAAGGGDTVAAHVAGTGLPALALFVPLEPRRDTSPADPLVDEVVTILRACQTAEDELVVLREVCGRVRRQLHAAAVAFVAGGTGRCDALVTDGGRVDPGIAQRALAATICIPPHRHDDRVEAAAPVQYGGSVIGALCVRWTLGSTYDLTRASTVLTMTAAAVAPVLSAALVRRERTVAATVPELIGVTPVMQELRRGVERAASAPFAVLIEGESGSGKELVAQAIHRTSLRRDRAFRALNCAALPDDLVEAELFGHVRGAFTGAVADRTGVFEEAHGGTLFLDEVGELSPRAQAKLLRVIQEGEIRRVGENLSRRVDVRIVAASNRDLRQEVEAGRLRVDLLYRLDVIRIAVPPLRDRAEDVPLLVDHFWREATSRVASRATLAAATLAALARYHWPGNVRELQNVLAALAVRCARRGVVGPAALPPQFGQTGADRGDAWRLEEARRTFEERFVRAALVRSGGHRGRAAAELGVTRQGLTKLMSRLGIA